MSRIGRMPIALPAGVTVNQDGNRVTVQGPRGTLSRTFRPEMQIVVEDGSMRVERPDDSRTNRALHGLTRALLSNMVVGVTEGFRKRLVVAGVGYRAEQQGSRYHQPGFMVGQALDPSVDALVGLLVQS